MMLMLSWTFGSKALKWTIDSSSQTEKTAQNNKGKNETQKMQKTSGTFIQKKNDSRNKKKKKKKKKMQKLAPHQNIKIKIKKN